jgi:hypothetical protein
MGAAYHLVSHVFTYIFAWILVLNRGLLALVYLNFKDDIKLGPTQQWNRFCICLKKFLSDYRLHNLFGVSARKVRSEHYGICIWQYDKAYDKAFRE